MNPPRLLRAALAPLAVLLAPTLLAAAPPVVNAVNPRGLERGKPVEVVVQGANLTPQTKLLLPFPATQEQLPDPKPNPAQVRFRVTAGAEVPVGVYPARVATGEGISGVALVCVDVFPNVLEVEDNGSPEKAQKLSVPVVVNGQCAGGDVDFFRFPARKGQRLVIETEAARVGSGVLPQIRLTDDRLRFLASDDSQALNGDCRIVFTAPADGDYLLEFSDTRYRGGNPPHYRIKIGEYGFPEEVFPLGGRGGSEAEFTLRGGTLPGEVRLRRPLPRGGSPFALLPLDGSGLKLGALSAEVAVGTHPERFWTKAGNDPKALDLVAPVTVNGRLETKGEAHRFQMPVKAGQRFRFAVQAQPLGSRLDGVLRITDQAGKQLALVDDVDVPALAPGLQAFKSADPVAEVTVPADCSLLVAELRDQRRRGGLNFGYRLTVEPAASDFLLLLPASEVNVPRGGSAAVSVSVVRRGYAGPIRLSVPNPPPGLTVQGGQVPAGGTSGLLTLTAAADAPQAPVSLTIKGAATDPAAGDLHRTAEHRLPLNRDPAAPPLFHTLTQLAVGFTEPGPFTVRGPAQAVELVKGYPIPVPVMLTRTAPAAAVAIEVTGLSGAAVPGQQPPPGGLTFKPGSAAANATTASFDVTAPANAPEGPQSITVQGKAKVNNADRTAVGPAFAVSVVRPFTVEAVSPTLTLTPGQTVPLKVKLTRRGPFKEAVQLKLDGLPGGVALAAPIAPIAANQSEAVINLKVPPKVAAATANLTLTATATVNGMAFTHPPVTVAATVGK